MAMRLAPVWDAALPEASLLFAGDAMQHTAQLDAARRAYGSYDYSEYFCEVDSYISAADYAVVNLETPLAGRPYSGYPCFNAPDSYAAALKDAGFDLFLTANNHTLDRGDRGLRRTISALDSLGLDHIGTYASLSRRLESIPFVKDINGFRVGFLNYTYGTNGINPGPDVVVDYIDTALIRRDVAMARKNDAEIVCVTIHWGEEYSLLPNKSQRQLADFIHSLGVELLIGSHPHVIQPMEMRYNPLDSLDRSLTVYSLGNFISNMKTRDTRGGVMVKVDLIRDLHGVAHVLRASYVPVFTVPATRGFNYYLIDATREAPPHAEPLRTAFIRSATDIFDSYNIDVPRDTTLLN